MRKPGRLMRCSPLITRSRCWPYLSVIRMTSRAPACALSNAWMKPSSLRTFAISFFNRDEGTSTRSCLAIFALRMRVSMSATGSVITAICLLLPLPRCLGDARNLAAMRELAEADPAQAELAQVASRPAAALAAVVLAHRELLFALRFFDHRSGCHVVGRALRRGTLLPQRHAHLAQERQRVLVVARGRDDDDVHAADHIDLVVVDLGEHELLAQAERVIAAAIERAARHAAKIADARQHDVHELVEKCVHALPAQRDLSPDLHAGAQLVGGHGLAGPSDHRLLAGDREEVGHGSIDGLRVGDRLAHTHVDDDLHQTRDLEP